MQEVSIHSITPYSKNAKKHPQKQVEQIAASIREFGFNQPIVVDKDDVIIVGHGRYEAAKDLGLDTVPVIKVDLTEEQAKAYRLADNKLNESDWDMDLVIEELRDLSPEMIELSGFGDLNLDATGAASGTASLADRFGVPPFSVLNARDGTWQDRKREWLSLGIKSEEGRGDEADADKNNTGGLLMKSWTSHPDFYSQKTAKEKELGHSISTAYFIENYFVPPESGAYASGTSIFDPVLCELAYRWFSPTNGSVLDPFAGGSVRGVIASKLGLQYVGVELRSEQVEANRKQAEEIVPENQPVWICGDSNVAIPTDMTFDFVFSCPPYADLEVYSDDPSDLSNMPYSQFLEIYRSIISKAVAQLKNDRFACFVVGEVRDSKGVYYDFVGDTIKAFMDAGMSYYNEIILVTAVGSLPIRAAKQFNSGRKIGKTHQNVLVFYKGDPKQIKNNFGDIDLSLLDEVIPSEE